MSGSTAWYIPPQRETQPRNCRRLSIVTGRTLDDPSYDMGLIEVLSHTFPSSKHKNLSIIDVEWS